MKSSYHVPLIKKNAEIFTQSNGIKKTEECSFIAPSQILPKLKEISLIGISNMIKFLLAFQIFKIIFHGNSEIVNHGKFVFSGVNWKSKKKLLMLNFELRT